MKKNEQQKFEYLMQLITRYQTLHPDAETLFNFVEWVNIDVLIDLLEKAGERALEFEFIYPESTQIIYKGYKYLEVA